MYNRLNCFSCISCFQSLCNRGAVGTIVDDVIVSRMMGFVFVLHRNYLHPLMNSFLDTLRVFINFVVTKTVAS